MSDESHKNYAPKSLVADLNERSRAIFREIVDSYLATGEPVGSQFLASRLPFKLSPASIRSLMSELEARGLLYAPHTSAGRIPTHAGLRFFVDALLEIGGLSDTERHAIESRVRGHNRKVEDVLTEASAMLSGLSHCAGLVAVSKTESPLKHVEFVPLEPGRCLVILVTQDGKVENRVMEIPQELTPSTLREATNYLNARVGGQTLDEAAILVREEIAHHKDELNTLTKSLIEAGLASWSGEDGSLGSKALIVRGQANLLENVSAQEDIERIRQLFEDLENKEDLLRLLNFTEHADGVRIFIGAETKLFSMSGSSLVISPYMNAEEHMVGVLGVIGPTRLNYARIIPMVDYTAKVVSQLLR